MRARFIVSLGLVSTLVSCTMGPTDFSRVVAKADGSTSETKFTTAGVTILTRNQYEDATVTKGGFQASHKVYGKDEVAVPRYQGWSEVGTASANALGDVTDTIVEGVTQ
jgi:hypothetical protein